MVRGQSILPPWLQGIEPNELDPRWLALNDQQMAMVCRALRRHRDRHGQEPAEPGAIVTEAEFDAAGTGSSHSSSAFVSVSSQQQQQQQQQQHGAEGAHTPQRRLDVARAILQLDHNHNSHLVAQPSTLLLDGGHKPEWRR